MEIKIENKTIKSFREISRQIKKIQETAETVVPDINDDIGKIVSTNTALFLKSKEVSGRGVLIGGEAEISVLYITEGESTVSFLRTTKAFTMEYDVDGADNDTVAQIALSVTNAETRVLNPRKVSVTVEISGEMSCFKQENAIVQSMLPGSIRPVKRPWPITSRSLSPPQSLFPRGSSGRSRSLRSARPSLWARKPW